MPIIKPFRQIEENYWIKIKKQEFIYVNELKDEDFFILDLYINKFGDTPSRIKQFIRYKISISSKLGKKLYEIS